MAALTGAPSAFLLFALAVLPHASAAAATARHFTTADLTGRYELFVRQGVCAPSIEHLSAIAGAAGGGTFVVPHTSITESGAACASGGALGVVASERALAATDMRELMTAAGASPAAQALARQGARFLVGAEREERRCGRATVAKGTVVLFVEADVPVTVPGLVTLRPGARYMIVYEPGRAVPCTYSAGQTADAGAGGARAEKKPAAPPAGPAGKTAASPAAAPQPVEAADGESKGKPVIAVGGEAEAPPAAVADTNTESAPAPSAAPAAGGQDTSATSSPAVVGDTTIVDSFDEGEPIDDGPMGVATPEPTGVSACFPGSTLVRLSTGALVPLSRLQLGDRVAVGNGEFSDVFMFTHRDASARARFVRLETTSGAVIRLTAGHYLYVNGRLRAAGAVRVGDVLRGGDGIPGVVTRVGNVQGIGLFNPQTAHGDIVVDGVTASTYTRAVAPRAAHALLAPVRALFGLGGFSSEAFDKGAGRLGALAPRGRAKL